METHNVINQALGWDYYQDAVHQTFDSIMYLLRHRCTTCYHARLVDIGDVLFANQYSMRFVPNMPFEES